MSSQDEIVIFPNGAIGEAAEYKNQILPEYRGNPLIEALPDILSKEDFIDAVTNYRLFYENDRSLPTHLRLHCVMRL
jgi:hypothetical protein